MGPICWWPSTAVAARPTPSPRTKRARRLLRDQLGLEPGGELQRLERAILDQDPQLLAPAATMAPTPQTPELRRSPVRYTVTQTAPTSRTRS